jgi:hypothetical protein
MAYPILHFHTGLLLVVTTTFVPPVPSRPALFCLRTCNARSSISLDRSSISSKLCTRSFTLPPLLLRPPGIGIGADAAGRGDTGRSSTSRLGTCESVGIRLGTVGACCRCTRSFGCAGRGRGFGWGVITGPRVFSNTSRGGRGRPGRAGSRGFCACVFFLSVGRYEKKNPFMRLPTDGVEGTSGVGSCSEGLDFALSCLLSDLASSSKCE